MDLRCPFVRGRSLPEGGAQAFGFRLARTRGSHHIFVHDAFPELLNLQSVAGQAKPYQVRQLLHLVERYNLVLEDDDE
jgi:hypothetical protein